MGAQTHTHPGTRNQSVCPVWHSRASRGVSGGEKNDMWQKVTEGGQTNDTQTQGHTDEAGVDVCVHVGVLVCVY